MTLLAPWQAVVAASFAVPALLLLYMLRLRRRPVRVSTSMFWASAAKDLEANVPFRWLRPSWLLFLQLLALLLLIGALGRPALRTDTPNAERIIIVLDRTASTGAVGDNGQPVFELLRAGALERISALQRAGFEGEVALVLLDSVPSLAAGPSRDLREVRLALDTVMPTDQPGDVHAAMRLAAMLSEIPDETTDNPDQPLRSQGVIEFYTDGALDGGLPPNSLLCRMGLNADVPSGNVGIVNISARRDVDDPSLVRVLISVVAEISEPSTVPIALTLDGARLTVRPVALIMDQEIKELARGTLTEPLRLPRGGHLEVELLRPDPLASDNLAGLWIPPPPSPSIVLVQPDRSSLQNDSSWVLIEVLRAMNPRSLLAMTGQELLDRGIPEGTDLVLLDGVDPLGAPQIGQAMLLFGVDPRFDAVGVELGESRQASFVSWDRRHPIWRGTAIDSIRWSTGLRFLAEDEGRVIATTQSGPAALLDERAGTRRLALSFRPSDSTWPTHHSFALFIANAVEFLTLRGEGRSGRALTTGLPSVLSPDEFSGGTAGTLTGPDGRSRPWSIDEDGLVRLGLLDRAGRYAASQGTQGFIVSLLDEQETRLHPRLADSKPERAQSGPSEPDALARDRGLVEIWWWFVIPAAVLLVAEWMLYSWRARV